MQILACSRMLYQVRRKILPTIQDPGNEKKAHRYTNLGALGDLRTEAIIITTSLVFFVCFLFPQGIHMWFHIYNSSHFQKALLQWRGRSLNGWKSLFPNWVIKVLFQFVWSNSMPQEFSCVTGQKSSAKCLKTVGFLFLIATRNTWPSKHNHTTCPA